MIVKTPSDQGPTAQPSANFEPKPVGMASSKYAVLRQAADVVGGGRGPQSTPFVKQEPQPFFLEGSTQVVVVRDKLSHTPDIVGQNAPQRSAGVSPHAPEPLRRGKKRKGTKDSDLNIRMTSDMRSKLDAKADALESYPSAHVLELIAADLRLPVDEHRATRNKYLKKAYADLRVAFDDCGVNLNQMAKATNSGKSCSLTRQEIGDALQKFKKGCATLESLRPK